MLVAASREAFGLMTGRAALHVDDLAVTNGEHLEALVAVAISPEPRSRADDLLANLRELRLHLGP